jgi:protein TonB
MRTPAWLRVGAGALVLGLHLIFIAAFVLGKKDVPLETPQEPAVMVSVIEAPAPQQAKAVPQPQPQPPAPAPQPPAPPVEEAVEPPPPPVRHVEPLAPVIKPQPKPPVKPVVKPQPVKPQVAPTPPVPPTPAPVQQAPAGAPEGQQQTSQAPRQDEPVMVNSVEFDGPRPALKYPQASRLHREEGRTIVLVRISTQGTVEKATIDTSSGFSRLDDSALDTARQARFKPLIRNGVAVTAYAKLPFDFKMRN